MKKLAFLFVLIGGLAFGQRHGGFGGARGGHEVIVRPPIVRVAPVGPRVVIGGGFYAPWWDYNYGYGFGYPLIIPPYQTNACQKETLKDENGVKHQFLACRQPDGTIKIVSADGTVR